METFAWCIQTILVMVVWRCATREHGALCVGLGGAHEMQLWSAGNWATPLKVIVHINVTNWIQNCFKFAPSIYRCHRSD